jgi:hypothetical protein
MKRLFCTLLGVTTLACGGDSNDGITTFGDGEASTTPTTADPSASSTGVDTGSTGEPTSSTTTDPSTTTDDPTTGGSTTDAEPVCGDGMQEGTEECDDGNDSDLDDCTVDCAVPTCDDEILSGDETDVDCGGPCSPCEQCLECVTDLDCESGFCNPDKLCGFQARVTLDAVDNCSPTSNPTVNNVVIPNVPPGTYVATAVMSAWTGFPPPWSPPSSGWTYYALCEGFTLDTLRTPDDVRYGDAATAFASIMSDTETFAFGGGNLSCGRTDTVCSDNSGSVIFDVSLTCD